jgi:hypothetical protein
MLLQNTHIFADKATEAVGNKYDRSVNLYIVISRSGDSSYGKERVFTLLSLPLCVARADSKFFAWSPIRLLEILDRQPMTAAS